MLLSKFFTKHGVAHGSVRLPFRLVSYVLDRIHTYWLKLWLKEIMPGSIISFGAKLENPNQVKIGENCRIRKGCIFIAELATGSLEISDMVEINEGVKIDHTGAVKLGSSCLISENAVIYSHSHGYNPRSVPVSKDLTIDSGVWIGAGAVITENCNMVGKNSIIAAGSVVTKDVADNVLVAGVPAKVIKRLAG